MAVEIEKKYRLPADRADILRLTLKDSGAEYAGKAFEENIIYGGESLDRQTAILRIRTIEDKAILTFKRRIENISDIKRQIEHESEFTNPTALMEILNLLGFVPKLIYEKRRETWSTYDTEIVIDELPFGLFMEIEGEETAIRETEVQLGINDLEAVMETYPQLTVRFGKNVDGIIEARF
jgi:adenylate cyclase class 2